MKAERDELKREVIIKRKSSEKDEVCREIQELREELSSLDKATPAPVTEGASSRVTIKDLRNMNSLNRTLDSNYSPVYFDDDDDDADVTTKTLKGKSKRHKIKSGKAAKSSEISVKTPQHWPHSFVSDHKDMEYKGLNMTQFVAGY